MAGDVPEPPDDLGLDGRRLWGRAWDAAITWLSPQSDMETVEQACRLADDLALSRERYRVTREPADMRAMLAADKQLREGLSALGFDPTSRSRLGLAEVKRVSKLDELRAKHAQARG